MASIGGIKPPPKKVVAARAARFAVESSLPPPEVERRFAHADFSREKIVRSDPVEKLVALCKRKLGGGDDATLLSDGQRQAMADAGISIETLIAEAAAEAAAAPPAIYAELGKKPKRRKSVVGASVVGGAPGGSKKLAK